MLKNAGENSLGKWLVVVSDGVSVISVRRVDCSVFVDDASGKVTAEWDITLRVMGGPGLSSVLPLVEQLTLHGPLDGGSHG